MPQVSKRPAARHRALPGFLLAALALFAFLLVPNPLLDTAVSTAAGAALGKPVKLRGVRPEGLHTFSVREIDLLSLSGASDTASSGFVKRYRLEEWMLLRDTRWAWTYEGGSVFTLRLLDAQAGESRIKGGLRFDGGGTSKASAALWLPREVWRRFPELVEKRFSEDAQGRRLFKLTWSGGLWRLWGRSAPVLEAYWR